MRRRGDHVPVLVKAADGWCYVMHDPAEYAALWKGVDVEVVEQLSGPAPKREPSSEDF
jgi:hypothetical protein